LRTAARKAARGQAPKPPTNAPASNARAGWMLLPLLPVPAAGWFALQALRLAGGFGLVGLVGLVGLLLLAGALGLAMATRWRPPKSKQHEEPPRTGKA
jgi:hypothetical protein